MLLYISGEQIANSICVNLDHPRHTSIKRLRCTGYPHRYPHPSFRLQRTQLLKDWVLGIQLQNTLCVYALTAVDSSLLVEHLLHLERYRAFGTQAARMALETAGQLDLLNLALDALPRRFEDTRRLTQLFDLFLLVLAVQTEVCASAWT